MLKRVSGDIYWSVECGTSKQRTLRTKEANPSWYLSGKEVHSSVNAFVINGDESLVFDTLGPASDQKIINDIEEIVGENGLDYIVLSHMEPPHAANGLKIKDHFPDARIVTSTDASHGQMHDLYGIEDAIQVDTGDQFDLGKGYEVEFHRTIFTDMGMTIGMFEHLTKTLFTVDWVGYYHMDGQCGMFADEIAADLDLDSLVRFHSGALYWFKYADSEKVGELLDLVEERYNPEILAPAHGNVIREDTKKYLDMMNDVIHEIKSDGLKEWGEEEEA